MNIKLLNFNKYIQFALGSILLFATILLAPTSITQADTVLGAGDIVIVGMSGDIAPGGGGTAKSFSFAPLVDLEAGTIINFTDSGWLGTSFRANEGGVIYTTPAGGIPAGTLISASGTSNTTWAANGVEWTAPPAGVGSNGMNFSTGGDQVLVYTGDAASPNFLFALNGASTIFSTPANANDSNRTALPTGLTQGVNAIAAGAGSGDESEYDNVYYTGITVGTKTQLLASVANSSNWTGHNTNYIPMTTNFIIIPDVGELVINEIMYHPSTSSGDDEWFEVKNISGSTLSINGCVITDNDGGINHVITGAVNIAAQDYYIFAATGSITGVGIDYNYNVPNALTNTGNGDAITLTCSGTAVDTVDYQVNQNGWPASVGISINFSVPNGSSGNYHTDNDIGTNWGDSTTAIGGGNTDLGTPGSINDDWNPTAVSLQSINVTNQPTGLIVVSATILLLITGSLWLQLRKR